jgi:hypothetical protein
MRKNHFRSIACALGRAKLCHRLTQGRKLRVQHSGSAGVIGIFRPYGNPIQIRSLVWPRDKGYDILKIGKKLGMGASVVQRVFKEVPSV